MHHRAQIKVTFIEGGGRKTLGRHCTVNINISHEVDIRLALTVCGNLRHLKFKLKFKFLDNIGMLRRKGNFHLKAGF